ncbi:VOC family protein [Aliikangiella coralliicola]|uniref:VOC family protein n=1 Tax=Aliikangiella coralliicola TaxID=2592383 RepID=A0A545UJ27_9GAMM|nr:VOC family protein [Aliikangiella coralliicola]TQV89465.1 VOC family protein [Aliikangiella coralliicola]
MLHLEHLNLVVKNITESIAFYQAAFPHWKIRGGGENDWYGKPRKWVHFGDDYQYLSLNDNGVDKNRDLQGHQVGLAHFAYVTNDIDGVIKRLQNAGFEIAIEGADDPYRKNVYFIDPDGYEVEFVEYLSDDPKERNRY